MSDGDFQNPYPTYVDRTMDLYRQIHGAGVSEIIQQRSLRFLTKDSSFDYKFNADFQLVDAAIKLLQGGMSPAPEGWDEKEWNKLLEKSDYKRLAIAGALIAAEIDRINYNQ